MNLIVLSKNYTARLILNKMLEPTRSACISNQRAMIKAIFSFANAIDNALISDHPATELELVYYSLCLNGLPADCELSLYIDPRVKIDCQRRLFIQSITHTFKNQLISALLSPDPQEELAEISHALEQKADKIQ